MVNLKALSKGCCSIQSNRVNRNRSCSEPYLSCGPLPRQAADRAFRFMPFSPIWNVTGQPAASLPLHWTRDGLPVGVQVVARFGQEETLFSVAAQIEQARPWAHRLPTAIADIG